jgi:starvation-inducible outer membrane lipoprotein
MSKTRHILLLFTIIPFAACVLAPRNLERSRHKYNEAVVKTRREELLRNIVRLRYVLGLRFTLTSC